MGRVGRFLQFIRGSKVDSLKNDIGGGDNHTSEIYAPLGEDAQPLSTDYCITVSTPGSGKRAVIGWVDPKNQNTSKAGAKRQYSRNATGKIVAEFILDNDGTVNMKNNKGDFTMSPNGDVNINGVIIDANGNISTNGNIDGDTVSGSTDVVGGGKSMIGHVHVGSPTAPVGPVSPTGVAT